MPAKAGIQKYHMVVNPWTPDFAGVTTFYGHSDLCPLGKGKEKK
jgi:hypothetical protein